MHRFFSNIRLLAATLLLTACTPARTGVIDNTLTTNVKPPISITGMAPFMVQDHGRMVVNSGPPSSEGTASLIFNYAFFADKKHADRLAYAAIVRITDENWHFQPPTSFDGAFSESRQYRGGFQWSEQLLRAASEKDWASGVWEDNGGAVPEFWLVKRWITHINNTTRAVMEYREPWPDTIRLLSDKTLIVSDEANKTLQQFLARADAVFTVDKNRGEFDKNDPIAPPRTIGRVPLDVAKTIGTVRRLTNSH